MIPETARRPDWPRLVKKEQEKSGKRIKELEQMTAAKLFYLNG